MRVGGLSKSPWALCCVLGLLAASGCKGGKKPAAVELAMPDACDGIGSGVVCEKGVALTCEKGDVASQDDCASKQLACSSRGCEACQARYYACEGNKLYQCNDQGTQLNFLRDCGSDLKCSARGCADLCGLAKKQRSYIGCEYWPVFTLNSQLDPVFQPAVVVGNPNLVAAHVTLHKGSKLIAQTDVPPGASQTLNVTLTDTDALRTGLTTQLVRDGAYHLVSDVPVIAHQFNPLLFQFEGPCARSAPGYPPENPCHSYTNDASLLLPAHVLSRPTDGGISYLGISRTSFMTNMDKKQWEGASGFLAMVAVGDKPVNVTIRSSAYTLGSGPLVPLAGDAGTETDAGPADAGATPSPQDDIPALSPGDSYTVTLQQGDVLQLLTRVPTTCTGTSAPTGRPDNPDEVTCDPGPSYDLTGSAIDADGPLQVIGGHDCTYVPFDRIACDHLEDSLFPLETWGKRVIVGKPRETAKSLYRLRVISGANNNQVTFTPAISAPITLDKGEWKEIEADQNVLVTAKKAMAVAQYFVGQGAVALNGDPSLALVPPVEQYRNNYNFLSPATYTSNYVTIIAPTGASVVMDGDSVLGFEPIGNTGYSIATILLKKSGDHEIHTDDQQPFGISLYGFGAYTSYMLPGGLDLNVISSPI